MRRTLVLLVSLAVTATTFGQTAPSGRPSAKQPPKSQTAPAQPAPQPTQSAADQGPSFEETMNWIRDKIDSFARHNEKYFFDGKLQYDSNVVVNNVEWSKCDVSWKKQTDYKGENHSSTSRTIFSLGDIARVSIQEGEGPRRGAYFVDLFTSSNQGIRFQEHNAGDWPSNLPRQVDVRTGMAEIGFGSPDVDNTDLAKRVAKAFEHAVALCQKMKPASKEPF